MMGKRVEGTAHRLKAQTQSSTHHYLHEIHSRYWSSRAAREAGKWIWLGTQSSPKKGKWVLVDNTDFLTATQ